MTKFITGTCKLIVKSYHYLSEAFPEANFFIYQGQSFLRNCIFKEVMRRFFQSVATVSRSWGQELSSVFKGFCIMEKSNFSLVACIMLQKWFFDYITYLSYQLFQINLQMSGHSYSSFHCFRGISYQLFLK